MIVYAVKKVSSSIFLIILAVIGYFMWNNFEIPKVFFGETKDVEGQIYNITVGYGIRGIGFIQKVNFVYTIDNQNYIGTKKIGNRISPQSIGNTVVVKVSRRNPNYYDVRGFISNYSLRNFSKSKYLRSSNSEYEEILIENGIFKYKNLQNGGIEKYSLTGIVFSTKDTIKVECFMEMKLTENNQRVEKILENDMKRLTFIENEKELINIISFEKFKVLTKGNKN